MLVGILAFAFGRPGGCADHEAFHRAADAIAQALGISGGGPPTTPPGPPTPPPTPHPPSPPPEETPMTLPDRISLKGPNGKFLNVNFGKDLPILFKSDHVGADEQLRWVPSARARAINVLTPHEGPNDVISIQRDGSAQLRAHGSDGIFERLLPLSNRYGAWDRDDPDGHFVGAPLLVTICDAQGVPLPL